MAPERPAIIPCQLLPEVEQRIQDFVEALTNAAPGVARRIGVGPRDFAASGLFRSAIERLRGTQAASMVEKRRFMSDVLEHLRAAGEVAEWEFTGAGERHDYQIRMPHGKLCVVETKGCLDGNNTNIFERPPQADEFVIWSLCQNPGADPRHNAWSGIHTRLGAELIHRKQRIDGLVIWDMVCGTKGRPCPKISPDADRATRVDERVLSPPCLYLFPRSIPDPRSNPYPRSWRLDDVELLRALWRCFRGDRHDLTEVRLEVRMKGSSVERKTHFLRAGREFVVSDWVPLKRAAR